MKSFLKRAAWAGGIALVCAQGGWARAETRCSYVRDQAGVVHLKAQDGMQAIECMGYFHGLDRGWQIDYFRRVGQGRTAEVLGGGHLKLDFVMRLFNLEASAHKLFLGADAETRKRIEAYASGVNQGMSEAVRNHAYEFDRLGYEPDSFLPEHAFLILLVQSFDQTRRAFEYRIEEFHVAEKRGLDWVRLKDLHDLPWGVSVLDEKYPASASSAQDAKGDDSNVLETHRDSDSTGSNNWVVAKSRSATGHSWLANDPHLDLKTPSFWYWIDVDSPEEHKMGATVAGFPQVVSGTNGKLAWGLTNAYLDYADVALVDEKELDSGTTERPTIWFKWWKIKLPFFLKTFHRTAKGSPVLPIDAPDGKAFVVNWSGAHYEPKDFAAVLNFSKAQTVDQMSEALAQAKISGWNFVFTDQSGRIGYRATGRAFLRTSEVPFGVGNRTLAEFESQPMLTEAQMPNFIDPKSGVIATANNRQFPKSSGLFGGRAYSQGFRAYRIKEKLDATALHDFKSLQDTQCDTQAVDARFLLNGMLALTASDLSTKAETQAVELLKEWKFETGADCRACAIYRRWVDLALDDLGIAESGLFRLLQSKDRERETKEILIKTFRTATDELLRIGKGAYPAWNDIHRVRFAHLSGDSDFDRDERFFTPGDQHSVNVGTVHWRGEYYEHTAGASQRVLIEMSDPVRIHYRLPGTNPSEPPKEFLDEKAPWKEWAKCTYSDATFGADWNSSAVKELTLSASSGR